MGFHGYGRHTSCVLGCSVAGCSCGHERQGYRASNTTYRHDPDRSIVPGHPNNGLVDLSKIHTPTGRGTWSFGGQPRTTSTAENTAPARDTQPVRPAEYWTADESSATTEAGDDEGNSDEARMEYERRHAALLEKIRATGFPLPIRAPSPSRQARFEATSSRAASERIIPAPSPTPIPSQGFQTYGSGMRGLDGAGDGMRPSIPPQRPGVSGRSSAQSGRTVSPGETGSGSATSYGGMTSSVSGSSFGSGS